MIDAAQNNDTNRSWHPLTLDIYTREQLINLSIFIAQALPDALFDDPDRLPVIAVWGNPGNGKSMVIEAMMKTLLDEYDPNEMKDAGASSKMFLEDKPGDACRAYLSVQGTVRSQNLTLAFDRYTGRCFSPYPYYSELCHIFRAHAEGPKIQKKGVIFITDPSTIDNLDPGLRIQLSGSYTNGWNRILSLKVTDPLLQSDRGFQSCWDALQSYAGNPELHSFLADKALEIGGP